MKPESILIVDDEQNIRFTISKALAELPASVETASTGEEARKKSRTTAVLAGPARLANARYGWDGGPAMASRFAS